MIPYYILAQHLLQTSSTEHNSSPLKVQQEQQDQASPPTTRSLPQQVLLIFCLSLSADLGRNSIVTPGFIHHTSGLSDIYLSPARPDKATRLRLYGSATEESRVAMCESDSLVEVTQSPGISFRQPPDLVASLVILFWCSSSSALLQSTSKSNTIKQKSTHSTWLHI